MYKKGLVFILALGMTFNVTACGVGNKEVQTTAQTEGSTVEESAMITTEKVAMAISEVTSEETMKSSEDNTERYDISYKKAERLLTDVFGIQDEETGDLFSYTYMDVCTFDEVDYYVFHWSRLVEGHMTTISQLFVSTDYTKIYSGIYTGDKNIIYTNKNYLE